VGEEWVYRLRDYAPSERVRVLAIQPKKTSVRADVEFLDDPGRVENVPGARLRDLWANVVAFDELMANWQRIEFELTGAVDEVVVELVPGLVVTWEWSPVR
jgi:hypothetical protein